MNTSRFAFLDSLDESGLCVILDTDWYSTWRQGEGSAWLRSKGMDPTSAGTQVGLLMMDDSTKMEFILRWGNDT
jgi:hypothetical protein